jgi:hypothetical protein
MPAFKPIINALQTPGLLYSIIKNLRQQKKFIRQVIEPIVADARKNNDGSLDEEDINKITSYYGLAVPAVLGEAFCALRGKKMTATERLACTCQGAITGLGDDFFDKNRLGEAELMAFLKTPENFKGGTTSEKLFLHFYKTALANAPDAAQMQQALYKVYFAQVQSKLQAKKELDLAAIKNITLSKGGSSLVFYRTVFTNPMDTAEENMLYKLGGLMQLGNDIFDVYKDAVAGIHTLMTTANRVNDIRNLFIQLLNDGAAEAYTTNYKKADIRLFLNILSIGVFSRCFVCLDHLEKNEAGINGVFSPARYSRKQLICDMDTASNKLQSLIYFVKYAL